MNEEMSKREKGCLAMQCNEQEQDQGVTKAKARGAHAMNQARRARSHLMHGAKQDHEAKREEKKALSKCMSKLPASVPDQKRRKEKKALKAILSNLLSR